MRSRDLPQPAVSLEPEVRHVWMQPCARARDERPFLELWAMNGWGHATWLSASSVHGRVLCERRLAEAGRRARRGPGHPWGHAAPRALAAYDCAVATSGAAEVTRHEVHGKQA